MKTFKYFKKRINGKERKFPKEKEELIRMYKSLDINDLCYLDWKNKKNFDLNRSEALRCAWSEKSVDGERVKKEFEDRVCNQHPPTFKIMGMIESGKIRIPSNVSLSSDGLLKVSTMFLRQYPIIELEE